MGGVGRHGKEKKTDREKEVEGGGRELLGKKTEIKRKGISDASSPNSYQSSED